MANSAIGDEPNTGTSPDGGYIGGGRAPIAAEVRIGKRGYWRVVPDWSPLTDVLKFGLGDSVDKELGKAVYWVLER